MRVADRADPVRAGVGRARRAPGASTVAGGRRGAGDVVQVEGVEGALEGAQDLASGAASRSASSRISSSSTSRSWTSSQTVARRRRPGPRGERGTAARRPRSARRRAGWPERRRRGCRGWRRPRRSRSTCSPPGGGSAHRHASWLRGLSAFTGRAVGPVDQPLGLEAGPVGAKPRSTTASTLAAGPLGGDGAGDVEPGGAPGRAPLLAGLGLGRRPRRARPRPAPARRAPARTPARAVRWRRARRGAAAPAASGRRGARRGPGRHARRGPDVSYVSCVSCITWDPRSGTFSTSIRQLRSSVMLRATSWRSETWARTPQPVSRRRARRCSRGSRRRCAPPSPAGSTPPTSRSSRSARSSSGSASRPPRRSGRSTTWSPRAWWSGDAAGGRSWPTRRRAGRPARGGGCAPSRSSTRTTSTRTRSRCARGSPRSARRAVTGW